MLSSRWLIFAACIVGLPGCTLNSVGTPSENGKTTKTEDFVEFDSPPVLLLSREQVATLREDPDLERAAAPIILLAEEALARAPTPLKRIIYGGRVSSDPERIQSTRQLRDMTLLDALAWAHAVTGSSKYAEGARRYLMAWIRACRPTGHMVNDHKLAPCFLAFHLVGEGLSRKERQEIIDWAVEMGKHHIPRWKDQRAGGNKPIKRIKMVLLSAIAADRKDWLEWADEKISLHLQASLRPNGRSLDLERRDALHYHANCMEVMVQVAHAGRLSGIDTFGRTTPDGASIRKSIDFMLPYVRGEKVHGEWVNSISSIDQRRWEAGDPYYRPGKPWDTSEAYKTLVLASSFVPSYKKFFASVRPKGKGLTGPTFFELIASQ